MSSFAKLAVVAAASAALSAGAVQAFQAEPLRLARLDAQGFAAGPLKPGGGAVAKAADGHFWAEAEVAAQAARNAQGAAQSTDTRVRFLVDTGATAVALTPQDAARLGFRPQDLKYAHNVTTAGGSARAAAVTLASVSIDGARLENVQALVVSDGLDVSLLGMSYLGRLTRFEATRETLRLEP
ncbi:TIGR02281 family clan AA aspartic protease [Phenylobacterium sp. SCN 70-31]|uniref:TIGR02281 family clan AA aspartic protease n=1 Tax=Phenylobacterium sp. SCN 70-31 TaxID=1660129 RepID=UPI00086D1B4B|nr:TIGR02281 family clan AA aspartic protease [Phenylobacterium sp. SCN 70-31]ODT88380.1 MAG: aspartyl protease [Phenylobacterium sp. SCN 70-31]